MRNHVFATALVFGTVILAAPAHAQAPGVYAGASLGSTQLDWSLAPSNSRDATVASFQLGYLSRFGVFVQGQVSGFGAEFVQTAPTISPGYPPIEARTRATVYEASIGYEPAWLKIGPLRPLASVGIISASVRDMWDSDVRESARSTEHGTSAAIGLEAAVGSHLGLLVSATDRRIKRAQPTNGFELSGTTLGVGIQLHR